MLQRLLHILHKVGTVPFSTTVLSVMVRYPLYLRPHADQPANTGFVCGIPPVIQCCQNGGHRPCTDLQVVVQVVEELRARLEGVRAEFETTEEDVVLACDAIREIAGRIQ